MASTHKSLRSSTANKRPTTSIADGQIALNTNAASPVLFFKDSTGADIIKVGPVHVGTTAPNATPATGGSSGNSTGEVWLDTSLTPVGVKIWDGSAWQNATPAGSTTVKGLLELATNGETQTGTDTARAVTPAGLQSKVSDSTSTTSSTTIASSTAVKSAYDLANAALPKSGGVITGNLEIGTTGSLTFEGATENAFETALAVVDPTADRTITFPDRTGTVITNADTGTVTSTMIADGTIVNADVNASAAIAGTKISPNFGAQNLIVDTNVLYVDASTDRVGIGSSSPAVKLQVSESSAGEVEVARFRIEGQTNNPMLRVLSDEANQTVTLDASGSTTGTELVFKEGNSEAFRIDSLGRLGLGTSSPGAALDVRAGANNTAIEEIAVFARPDAAVRATIEKGLSTGNGISFGTTTGQPIALRTDNTERLYIGNTGNVGIGTTSPDYLLHLANNGTLALQLEDTSTSTRYRIENTSGDLAFLESGVGERMRIDDNGRLLIGTSSPITTVSNGLSSASYLTLAATSTAQSNIGAFYFNNNQSGAPSLSLSKSRSTTLGSHTTLSDNDRIGSISYSGSDGSAFIEAARISAEVEGTPGANDMPGRIVFFTTANGASSPTERVRITSAGEVTVNSGFVTLNGNKVGGISVVIADNAFASITPPRAGAGFVAVAHNPDSAFPNSGCQGFIYADWGNSPVVTQISVGSSFETSTSGPPTGTTGSDNHATLFVGGTSGTVYLENRIGSEAAFFVTFT